MHKWWYIILPIIVFLVSGCDLVTTMYFAKTSNNFEEANPIVKYVWEKYGDTGFIVFKTIATLPLCVCMGWVLRYEGRQLKVLVTILGLTACVFLIGWWILWFFMEQAGEFFV